MLLIITVVFGLIGMAVSFVLKNKFQKYGSIPMVNRMSGKDVAQRMLQHFQIRDVNIICVNGQLTDHYNPVDKTVNLSPDVYSGTSIAAAAVAAHEVGHAVQHAEAYSMLQLRSKMVPVVNFSSRIMQFVFMFGIGIYFFQHNEFVLMVLIALQATITLFAVVTLPVEFDASRRALAFIQDSRIALNDEEYKGAKDMLTWAGMTYFVAALAGVAQLLYFILRFSSSRRDDD